MGRWGKAPYPQILSYLFLEMFGLILTVPFFAFAHFAEARCLFQLPQGEDGGIDKTGLYREICFGCRMVMEAKLHTCGKMRNSPKNNGKTFETQAVFHLYLKEVSDIIFHCEQKKTGRKPDTSPTN